MKTMVELPDDLYQQAEAHAAIRGVHIHDLLAEALRRLLGNAAASGSGGRVSLPIVRTREPGVLTSADVERARAEVELEEDLARARDL